MTTWPLHTNYVYEKFKKHPLTKEDLLVSLKQSCRMSGSRKSLCIEFGRKIDSLHRRNRQQTKGSRVYVIIFHWIPTEQGHTIRFQYAIFVDKTGKDQYCKRQLRQIALERFEENPIELSLLGETSKHDVKEVIYQEIENHRKRIMLQKLISLAWCHEYV